MRELSISEVRNRLPGLIDAVMRSRETIVITRHGKPVASIVPLQGGRTKEPLYPLRELPIEVAENFDEPMAELWNAVRE